MAEESLNHLQEAVVNNSNWVDKVLLSGIILAGMIVILKITDKAVFKWGDVELRTDKAWIVGVLFSLAHLYTTWLFVKSIHTLWKAGNQENCQAAFNKVTSSGGLFVRGLMPRVKIVHGVYQMSWSDPSTLISHLAVLLIIPAVVPFDLSHPLRFLLYLGISLILMVFNWIVGSNWAIALSQLTVERDKALYHLKRLKNE
jgi:hypothetical protein